jgi:DNA primase
MRGAIGRLLGVTMIPADIVREVLLRADIVQVIGDYVSLKRAGHSLKGLCPFHGEKTPSFHVTPAKNMYYCFGCGQGGNAIDFLMRIEGLSFPEAVERVGARFGIEVHHEHQTGEQVDQARAHRSQLLELMRIAENFFCQQLDGPGGSEARKYLDERSIDPNMRQQFRLGYAPAQWDALTQLLRAKRIEPALAIDAGLIAARSEDEQRGHYDRFRHRIIFPIIDAFGNTIAFGGRALDPSATAKYLNSPETSLFVKSRALYGIHHAKEAARRERRLFLVEGNFDVITMARAGFTATVAPMGTALGEDQVKLATRYAERLYLLFDGDNAGRKAALRAIAPLQSTEVDARVVVLPDAEDPDSFLRQYGSAALAELIEAAPPLVQWALSNACEDILAQAVESRGPGLDALGELLRGLKQSHVRQHYLLEAARKLGYPPQELAKRTRLSQAQSGRDASAVSSPVGERALRIDPTERELLRLLLESRLRREEFLASDGKLLLEDPRIRATIEAIEQVPDEDDIGLLLGQIGNADARSLALETLALPTAVPEGQRDDWYRGVVARLTERWIDKRSRELGERLVDALSRADIEEQERLARLHQQLVELRNKAKEDRKINWLTLQSEA